MAQSTGKTAIMSIIIYTHSITIVEKRTQYKTEPTSFNVDHQHLIC